MVSTTKLLVLFFSTLGTYQLYWFYKHWKCHAPYARRAVSPFWRSVFAIFFAHRLFTAFQMYAGEQNSGRPLQGMATLWVALTLATRMLDRLLPSDGAVSLLEVAHWCVGLSAVVPLYVAQRVANAACGDTEGGNNSQFTPVNYIFIGLGSLLWLANLASLALPDSGNPDF